VIGLTREEAQTLYDFLGALTYYEMMMILSKNCSEEEELEKKRHETVMAISRLAFRIEEDKRKEGKP